VIRRTAGRIRLHVPWADRQPPGTHAPDERVPATWAKLQIILEQHHLAVEHELQVRIGLEAVEHRIHRVEEARR
jgi:hypothetical protein